MAALPGIIALLTDFGLRDPYVGAMKGAVLAVNPRATLVDLSHDVPAQGVAEAAFLLSAAHRPFPSGTIFVTVVDPGVGSDRAILAVRTDRHTFLAPDNGLLGFLEEGGLVRKIVHITEERYFRHPVSRTFHGRDIFAPVAGHLSLGTDVSYLGPKAREMQLLPPSGPEIKKGLLVGEVVSVDRFGNLITNIPGERLSGSDPVQVKVGKAVIRGLSSTYVEGKEGALLALVGSTGHLEISVNRGDASRKTGAAAGDPVRVVRSTR